MSLWLLPITYDCVYIYIYIYIYMYKVGAGLLRGALAPRLLQHLPQQPEREIQQD